MSVPDFRRVVRGYDTDHVARYVRELNERLERLENERAENARSIQRLNRDVTDANDRAGRAKPSFADLGSAFEDTLRLAEEQSKKKSPRKQPQKLQRFWATPGAKQRGFGNPQPKTHGKFSPTLNELPKTSDWNQSARRHNCANRPQTKSQKLPTRELVPSERQRP